MAKPNPSVSCNGNGCPDGDVCTDCCPDGIPDTLTATLTNFEACDCGDGTTLTLQWDGSAWVGSVDLPNTCEASKPLKMKMFCGLDPDSNPEWKISDAGDSSDRCNQQNTQPAVSVNCDPFEADFTSFEVFPCCDSNNCNSFDVTVTE